jgi:hypothetical protein
LLHRVYARDVGDWAQPIAFVVLILACLVMGALSADSRPGFSGVRSTYKERWFPHSRRD